MDYIKIEGGIVTEHYDAPTPVAGCVEAPGFAGWVGIQASWLDANWQLKPQSVLVSEGLLKDNRGVWYNTTTRQPILIDRVGAEVPADHTDIEPGPFDSWNVDHWVTDTVAETAYNNQQTELANQRAVDAELAATCDSIIRWMEERFTIPQTDFDFIDNMTDIADVKVAMTGILNKLALDAGDLQFISNWTIKYDAWIASRT